ncbi:unnamed protein product [Rhizophagus irregularis]|nr:unnamed protein product [Rhizophagus irregularis]
MIRNVNDFENQNNDKIKMSMISMIPLYILSLHPLISLDTSENTLQITSQDTSQDNEDILQDILQDTPDNSSQIGIKKPRSIVHNHFTLDIENNKYKCNHCDKSYQIAKDGSTLTLKKHLQTKHNHLFSVDQLTDAMNKLEISLIFTQESFRNDFVHWIVSDDQPFTTIENMFFKKMIK